MEPHDPLMTGMFWAGLLVASVPILLTGGIVVYVVRRVLEGREQAEGRQRSQEG